MTNSRLRPWGALAIGLSLCTGLISTAHITTAASATSSAKKGGSPLDDILRKLKLSTDQRASVKDIIDNANASIKALNADTSLTKAEKKTAYQAIVDESYSAISALLTGDQKTTFDAWVAAQAAGATKTCPTPSGTPTSGTGSKGGKGGGDKGGGDKGGGGGDCKPTGDKPTGDKPTGTKPTPKPTGTTSPTPTPTATTDPTDDSGNSA